MSAHRNSELPGWLPFALVASGLVALGAGIRSGWRISGDESKPPPQPPPRSNSPFAEAVQKMEQCAE